MADALEEWTRNLHYYETVVLRKAAISRKLSESESLDMIGWALFCDSCWDQRDLKVPFKWWSKEAPSARLVRAVCTNMWMEDGSIDRFLNLAQKHLKPLTADPSAAASCAKDRAALKNRLKDLASLPAISSGTSENFRKLLGHIMTVSIDLDEDTPVRNESPLSSCFKRVIDQAIRADMEDEAADGRPGSLTKCAATMMLSYPGLDYDEQLYVLRYLENQLPEDPHFRKSFFNAL